MKNYIVFNKINHTVESIISYDSKESADSDSANLYNSLVPGRPLSLLSVIRSVEGLNFALEFTSFYELIPVVAITLDPTMVRGILIKSEDEWNIININGLKLSEVVQVIIKSIKGTPYEAIISQFSRYYDWTSLNDESILISITNALNIKYIRYVNG